ncbi:MAG: SDR family oxidoreductase [Alphaproteobacteria bacterium]|nr:SDR family oxidoreductase [Alphaproteobacteria bacterium]
MSATPFRFDGKHVFVAGGTSGINLGIALGFSAAGARVSVMSRNPDKVKSAAAEIAAHGPSAGFAGDVRSYEAVAAALASAHAKFGEIDVLISGAAGNFVAPALGMSSNGFRAVMEIDLLGTFHVMRAAHQYLTKPGASVINISAPQAYVPMMLQSHVCAAKAGIDMLTRTLAMEWARDGIRVNSIAPGPIEETEGMARLAPTEEARQASMRRIPLARWGRKDEIAGVAQFLSSPMAAYITGVVLPVDGGQNIGGYNPTTLDMADRMGIAARG